MPHIYKGNWRRIKKHVLFEKENNTNKETHMKENIYAGKIKIDVKRQFNPSNINTYKREKRSILGIDDFKW